MDTAASPETHLGADLVWVERRGPLPPAGRPALFLDRDGVVVTERHYLHEPGKVELTAGIGALVSAARRRGLAVVMVTNQAGIGRRLYGWPEFAATQQAIYRALELDGAGPGGGFDLVLACAHHAEGRPPYRHPSHPCRKPNPGMFLRAAALLHLDCPASLVVGDRALDLQAGRTAGLGRGVLVATGYGSRPEERAMAAALDGPGFAVAYRSTAAEAADLLP